MQYYNSVQHRWKVDKKIAVSCVNLTCCTSLRLTATGLSKQQWPESFGVFRYIGKDDKGGNVYGNTISMRYIVRDHKNKTWKIADGYGKSRSYYLSKEFPDGYFCPEHAIKGHWKYYNNDEGEWRIDTSIHLFCD